MVSQSIIAIVPAAGGGQRMNMSLPKQYIKIGQATILEHTLHKLLSLPLISRIIVVISPDDHFFTTLAIASNPRISFTHGGSTRAQSVLAGLTLVNDDSWALVHDAARPCVTHADIKKLVDAVIQANCGGILATKVTDTIKQSSHQSNIDFPTIIKTCDREYLWAAATPQMFKAKLLKESMLKAKEDGVSLTDEASAIEYCHGQPLLVECQRDNIKVTRPEDLPLATLYLQEQGYITK
ncbi:2-C-methyl-D-erythritol 4-phosphate cytidylyltransferase [Orbus hercynius]|uniref:2-C-methyl-D-erythritol 4-phosphate cytidylyltransferase n=1 Tax=Orbus hercynius TaxID=593135 RepID=A0A495RJX7_9GAMM|nr:2-C-methyl-D-erythritol 4-phosphate cytidylyltransferase [Orbus hercynius]RKS87088.1 2-C-methyl-D-erythritol 4-phosphate cytidylyltransferase [Orbus hercynius]